MNWVTGGCAHGLRSGSGWGQVGVGEQATGSVFATDRGFCAAEFMQGPGDGELWVVPEDGALSLGVVEVRRLVQDFSGFGEDQEAVGEAFGNPQKLEVAGRGERLEVEAGPSAKVRRVAA